MKGVGVYSGGSCIDGSSLNLESVGRDLKGERGVEVAWKQYGQSDVLIGGHIEFHRRGGRDSFSSIESQSGSIGNCLKCHSVF